MAVQAVNTIAVQCEILKRLYEKGLITKEKYIACVRALHAKAKVN